MQNGSDDLLWRHLKTVPAFRALLRAVEARFYHYVDIPEPVLDLGCGDGHFAAMAFANRISRGRQLAAGVDPWWGPLQKARRAGVYRLNVQAVGDVLPFAGNTFASVISNSVLEHIEDVQPVLSEASRVLRPGGKLVITMPSHLFTEYLGGAALLSTIGLAGVYRRFFNTVSRHAHTDAPQLWARRLAQAGFAVERWQYYFSKEALRTLELGHVQGLPSAITHLLTGRWVVAPWRSNLHHTERWVRPYYEEEPAGEGAYIFMVARKVATTSGKTQSIEVRLPAPSPLPTEEPPPPDQESAVARDEEPVQPAPLAEDAEVIPFTLDAVGDERGDEPESGARGLLHLGLLLAGLFAAYIGQSILAQRPPSALGGFAWYAVAMGAFLAAVVLERRQSVERSPAARSRRILLYPLAFFLALLAQEQAGGSATGGHPILGLALWFAAMGLAYTGLSHEPTEDRRPQTAAPSGKSLRRIISAVRRPSSAVVLLLFLLALIPRLLLLAAHPFMLNGIEASIGLDAIAALQGHIRNPFATAWLTNPTLPLFPASLPIALFGRTVIGLRLLPALVGAITVPVLFLIGRRLWNVWVAFAASLFLAAYHLHVHYSRLGMTNIWDPLLALLMFGLITIALTHPNRRNWLFAGLATGLSTYVYTASHLLPFYLLALALYLLLLKRDLIVRQWRNMLAMAALALVIALPQIVYYQANPGLFMERAQALSILHNDWLVQQAGGGQPVIDVLGDQLRRSFLAFNGSLDTSTSYNPGIPLLRLLPSVFFALGVAFALWRLRHIQYAILLIWLGVTLIFGSALLVDAPSSHRLLIAAPAVVLLTANGLFWLVNQFASAIRPLMDKPASSATGLIPNYRVLAALGIIFIFIAGDLFFYFGSYRNSDRFGDRNTEVAYRMGQYLATLEGDWTAYFHGPPAMYVSFPTILFLADDFQPGQNLIDVMPDTQTPAEAPADTNLVFIYLPERSNEVNQTSQQFDQGTLQTFAGNLSDPLFYSYEVRR
ncbi:MAG: methyltransferase domain-containing protein [Chloroflexota bacterium]